MASLWRMEHLPIAVVVGAVLLVAATLNQTTASLLTIWQTEGYQHSYLIPLVSLYFLWTERERLTNVKWRPDWLGLVVFSGLVLVWLVATLSLVQLIEQIAAIGIIIALIWAVCGLGLLKQAAFPLGFLFLAVPFGSELIPWLMELTTTMSMRILETMGMTIYREGFYLMLPAGVFEVAESCAGFQYLYSGVALSTLLAYTSLQGLGPRVLFVVSAALLYVAMNIVRVVIVILVASASEMTVFVGEDHVWFGWVLFGAVFMAQVVFAEKIGRRLSNAPT